MKILFYDTKPYDRDSFTKELASDPAFSDIEIEFLESDISPKTAALAEGFDAVCVFVASPVTREVSQALAAVGVRLILLRCAGFNNVDVAAAKGKNLTLMRTPAYSPEAVAEFAAALALAANRRLHKAYIKVRENNFSLNGLCGTTFFGKRAGIVGTGRIGAAMCRICRGFGMEVTAFDLAPDPELDFVKYLPLEELLAESDLISLHCPLTKESRHMINRASIEKMKRGVVLVNTSRGALINTNDLICGIRERRFAAVGLDVYEEEDANVFENREDDILQSSVTARLLSFPNVIVTSHQGFLTNEALTAISRITLQNAASFANGRPIQENLI